ncbi:MAG: peptidoglycan-binding protein [Oscillospiraceae bacterium]|nr:peptidoglycan-binding protein [Oscillospiraceae bacterium]
MTNSEKLISIALAEVGYREKASNAFLDDPQANAGSGNWNKYARDLALAGYYNGSKNGYAWCCCFVDWCFYKAFGASEGPRIQCQTGDLGAACVYSAQYFMMQQRYDKTPRPGDQVYFYVNGQIGHTGIVVEVTPTAIVTVEGNSSDRVQRLTYERSSARIAGYGHPRYDDLSGEDPVPEMESSPAPKVSGAGSVTVLLPLLKRGAVSNAVRNAQALLIRHGYSCGGKIVAGHETPDGDFGPATEKAVRSFQNLKKLEVDGEIGKDTWTALITK